MTRIDVHHHIMPPAYKAEFASHRDMQAALKRWTPEWSVEDMDKGGVTKALLSVTTPGFWFVDVAQTRRLVRESNDYAAKLVSQFPGRFGMFSAVPLPDIEGSLAEISYALDTLKADGLALFTNYRDRWLGDRRFDPVYEELDRRKTVVHVHPDVPTCCVNIGQPDFRDSMVDYGTDTSRAIGHIVFGGVAHQYPNIRFIFSHAGGTMPFITERFTREPLAKPELNQKVPDGVINYLKRFHYDTAQAAHVYAMSSLSKLVPTSQIVFGTDAPFRTAMDHVEGLKKCGCFSEADLRAIDSGNTLRLLPRLLK